MRPHDVWQPTVALFKIFDESYTGLGHAIPFYLICTARSTISTMLATCLGSREVSCGLKALVARVMTINCVLTSQLTSSSGVKDFMTRHYTFFLDETYIRFADEVIENGTTFRLILCLLPEMSRRLVKAKYLTIDTAFKRVSGWQEFEMEFWDVDAGCSVACFRAFFTSQTSEAHLVLLRKLNEARNQDTGQSLRFRHLHGSGMEVITADEGKGQALGLICWHYLFLKPRRNKLEDRMAGWCVDFLELIEHMVFYYNL